MATKEQVLKELDFVTDRLSSQVRTTALGVLALSWGLLVGETKVFLTLSPELRIALLRAGVAAVLVLFFDFLQYLFGFWGTMVVYRTGEKSGNFIYKYRDWRWVARAVFFVLKLLLTFVAVIYLVVTIMPKLVY